MSLDLDFARGLIMRLRPALSNESSLVLALTIREWLSVRKCPSLVLSKVITIDVLGM